MDSNALELRARVDRLEHQLSFMRAACAAAVVLVLGVIVTQACATARAATEPVTVLRARGLVIEDSEGRDRILIGAPIPASTTRKRTDAAMGIVLLNADGADRLQLGGVGDPQSSGTVQSRISPVTGLQLNDARGDERGGFGLFDNGRVVLGLDDPEGEGVMVFVAPDLGMNGVRISAPRNGEPVDRIFLATSKAGAGLSVNDTHGRARLKAGVEGETPAFSVLDESGVRVGDAAQTPKK